MWNYIFVNGISYGLDLTKDTIELHNLAQQLKEENPESVIEVYEQGNLYTIEK